MNNTSRPHSKIKRLLGKLLYTSLSVWLLGVFVAPAQAAVAVDQEPLIIQKPLPPNITLMLDDSGSMAWDFMPDICYLNGVNCNSGTINNDAMINANNNGVYYNPTVTYAPPVKADGTSFPSATGLTSAWFNGFSQSGGSADLTNYNGYNDTGYVNYSAFFSTGNKTTTYTNVTSKGSCVNYYNNTPGAYKYSYNSDNEKCVIYYSNGSNYFQYSTGPAAGPYVVHYVANSSCGTQTNCVLASDTSGTSAPAGIAAGQNIANWFSYYHTRILMAKSGLMTAYSTIDPTFRIGFGSINGQNNGALPAPTVSYNGKTLAMVQPFGDGSAGTQKSSFWNWLIGENPNYSTPLRLALDAVGQYYESAQPWQTSSSDTSELACRQSYTILTTDGFWNGPNPGNGNVDGTSGPTVTGPNGQSYTYTPVAPYSDTTSDTLADVAMKYWNMDLRSTVANEVPPSTEDPAFWQHMATFTMGLGFTPTGIKPTGTTIDQIFSWANGGAAISGFSWPAPSSNSIYNIADLAHAAVDGHGGFYSATNPESFASGIKDALKRAAERVGSGASLAANSTQLKTGTVAYQANYYTAKWKGDLKALSIDPVTGLPSATPNWTAASVLPAYGSRNIQAYNASSKQMVAFTSANLAALSTAELTALGSSATAQQNMINYLRGDAALEQKNGGSYRNRDTAFGDVVDSQPVYSGAPDPNQFIGESFTGFSTFAAYASSNASRTPVIYVAANDGMLHGFDATTGVETFALLPAAVLTNGVTQLANPDYGLTSAAPHQYFNDGELTVADAYFGSAWHTVAVGTTGRGTAKTIYALDITDPASIKMLWERSAGDGLASSSYIGQMTGKPVIAQTSDGGWSVLMGNGYNSAAGVAALLQFTLSDGTLNVHPVTDVTPGNGLAAPAVWIGDLSNGISTVAYAGDLHGQVWSFTLNTGITAATSTPTSTGTLLFTAKDASNKVQPITAGMLAGKDPATNNLWLFFGTGQYLSTTDLTNMATQSWYGLVVQSATASLVSNLTSSGRTALMQRAIVAETAGSAGDPTATPPVLPVLPARAITPAPTTPDMAGKSGWYIDLTSPLNSIEGERMVTPNLFQGNQLIGTTRIPQATDICNPSGRGWIMALDPFTGTSPAANFFDISGDGQINGSDTITVGGKTYTNSGVGFTALPNNPIFVGSTMLVSFDNGTTGSIKTAGSGGSMQRVSWRELINP